MQIDTLLPTFIAESRELLEDMEASLLQVTGGHQDDELVNALFRTAHTIKGSAGIFGFEDIVAFTHVAESVLDRVRNGEQALTAELVNLLLLCRDHMGRLIDAVATGESVAGRDITAAGAPLVEQLCGFLDSRCAAPPEVQTHAADDETAIRASEPCVASSHWHLSLRFDAGILSIGLDPLAFLRYLSEFGTIERIVTLSDAMPVASKMNPEACYLGFELALASDAARAAIENVFEFARDDSTIRIFAPHSPISAYAALLRDTPNTAGDLGQALVDCGTLTAAELDAARGDKLPSDTSLLAPAEAARPLPATDIDAKTSTASAPRKQLGQERSIRVDANRLDELINSIGELIIAGASVQSVAQQTQNVELRERMSILADLVESVRDSALQLRMVRIGATFNRFQRIVHDAAKEIGKSIRLEVSGEDTELDKTVVEKIADPLTHLVRNAIDHGIESATDRTSVGKPEQGTVRLNAYHDSGSIVIEVHDDGGGLSRERILAKATERGLVDGERALSDSEIFDLVFEPGFSTASKITNLSGRGVGMDVVKRNITAMRGSVGITSKEGIGTTVTMRLPLTLAIIDGFQVGVGDSAFVLPLDMIEECIELPLATEHDYTNLRGLVLPFVRLRDLFEVEGAAARRQSIVVLKYAGQQAGLVVDTLIGESQTVIKPMGKLFNQLKYVSGSTILGNGNVALILDVPSLIQQTQPSASAQALH